MNEQPSGPSNFTLIQRIAECFPSGGLASTLPSAIKFAIKDYQTSEQRIAELERDNAVLWEQLGDRDKLVAQVSAERAQLEQERDEARVLFESMRKLHKHAIGQWAECVNMLRDARAQLAASEKDRQWEPIETAPRDGTYFLAGWFVDEVPDPERFTMTVAFYGQILGNNLLSVPGKYNIGPQVSHWMPLPKAPDAAMKEVK